MKAIINDTVSVYRFETSGTNELRGSTPVYEGVNCLINPAGPDVINAYPDVPSFQLYKVIIYDNVTIQSGDLLKADDDAEYIVKGMPQNIRGGRIAYIRIVGEKKVI